MWLSLSLVRVTTVGTRVRAEERERRLDGVNPNCQLVLFFFCFSRPWGCSPFPLVTIGGEWRTRGRGVQPVWWLERFRSCARCSPLPARCGPLAAATSLPPVAERSDQRSRRVGALEHRPLCVRRVSTSGACAAAGGPGEGGGSLGGDTAAASLSMCAGLTRSSDTTSWRPHLSMVTCLSPRRRTLNGPSYGG